jgi:hypothetical protein
MALRFLPIARAGQLTRIDGRQVLRLTRNRHATALRGDRSAPCGLNYLPFGV